MVRKKDDVDNIVSAAEALEERARNRMATNQAYPQRSCFGFLDNRRLDTPTFLLAVIGAVVSMSVVFLITVPVADYAYHWWLK